MTEIDPAYLKHQYLYVPWTEGLDTQNAGKALARYISSHHQTRLTVVCPLKQNATSHPELAKLHIVTERSGGVSDGAIVLAWCPTAKVMKKVHHLAKSVVVLVEFPGDSFTAWAKLVEAYNVVTGELMSAGLSETGQKALEGVVREGYNGWHDDIAAKLTTSHIKSLAESDGYDRDIVLEYASQHGRWNSLDRLSKILDKYERTLVTGI